MARTLLRRLAASPAVGRAAALVQRLDLAHPRILRVLTYHRVDEPEPFGHHMEHLRAHYQVVSVARVLVAFEGGTPLPPRSVLLTFDDAYRSFADVAWPILERHGFGAALFVPTAYPDSGLERFWWDRLEDAFARTARRAPLDSPLGVLPMDSPAARAAAHRLLKAHVKDLLHDQTLETTAWACRELDVSPGPHEVLGWARLLDLAARGVSLGAHTATHPRLDRVPPARARDEILGSLAELERRVPGGPRLFAYPDGRFDDERVELLRDAGVELAFTTRRGTNDISSSDRLRLRRVNIDARDSLEVFRSKLAFSAARLQPLVRLLDPPSAGERARERRERASLRRSRYFLRALDAGLTARLRSRPSARRGWLSSSHYDRVGRAVRLVLDGAPRLAPRLERALCDTRRLGLRTQALELHGYGSGVTVFRLDPGAGAAPRALKVYRRTLGRESWCLAAAARGYRRSYQRLCAAFGAVVLPCEFVILHAPLRGVPAVACVQPWLAGPLEDVLALEESALVERLARQPALARAFAQFVRSALEWHAAGRFPDLLGAGNLVLAGAPGSARLHLIDYGVFHAVDNPPPAAAQGRLLELVARLRGLLARIERDALVLS